MLDEKIQQAHDKGICRLKQCQQGEQRLRRVIVNDVYSSLVYKGPIHGTRRAQGTPSFSLSDMMQSRVCQALSQIKCCRIKGFCSRTGSKVKVETQSALTR